MIDGQISQSVERMKPIAVNDNCDDMYEVSIAELARGRSMNYIWIEECLTAGYRRCKYDFVGFSSIATNMPFDRIEMFVTSETQKGRVPLPSSPVYSRDNAAI